MVVIRLSRGGSGKNPFYHIVVADRRKPRDGRYIEHVGFYNPVARGKDVRLKVETARIDYWVSKGAQPSERVAFLLNELKTSPEKAQQAAPRVGEMKRIQAAEAAKAHKKAQAENKKKADAEAAAAAASAEAEAPAAESAEPEAKTEE